MQRDATQRNATQRGAKAGTTSKATAQNCLERGERRVQTGVASVQKGAHVVQRQQGVGSMDHTWAQSRSRPPVGASTNSTLRDAGVQHDLSNPNMSHVKGASIRTCMCSSKAAMEEGAAAWHMKDLSRPTKSFIIQGIPCYRFIMS